MPPEDYQPPLCFECDGEIVPVTEEIKEEPLIITELKMILQKVK